MAEILEIAKEGILKTPIMYGANLNFVLLDEYLSLLLEIQLLETANKDGKTFYKTTAKGLNFVENYRKINVLFEKTEKWSIHKLSDIPIDRFHRSKRIERFSSKNIY